MTLEPADENVSPNKTDKEWSKEALEASTPKIYHKKSRWDQATVIPDAPMTQIIMNAMLRLSSNTSNRYSKDYYGLDVLEVKRSME